MIFFTEEMDRLKTQLHLKFLINSLIGPKTIFQTHLKVKSIKIRIQKTLEGLMLGKHASAEKGPVYTDKSCSRYRLL